MTIHPITAQQPACYGVCCPMHGHCSRYHAVDGHTDQTLPIATCEDGSGAYPLFLLQLPHAHQGLAAQPITTGG